MKHQKVVYVLFALTSLFLGCKGDGDGGPCNDINCQNGGICLDGTCDCPPGYSGEMCETYDPCYNTTCENGGYCVGGTCACPWGYYGPHCEYQKTPGSMKITKIDIVQFPLKDQNGNNWDTHSAQNPLQWYPDIFIEVYNDIFKVWESGVIESCIPGVKYTFTVNATINGAFTLCTIDLTDHDPGGGSNNDYMCAYKFHPVEYDAGFPTKFRLYDQNAWHKLILDVHVEWYL